MSSNPTEASNPTEPSLEAIAFWEARRGHFRTRKGGWIIGEAVYNHGYSMLEDLVGHCSFFQVLVLNVTGRLPEKRLADWLEACFICLSWPDPRIWCNQIGALAGTAQTSPVAAVTAGALAGDSRLYGAGTLEAATDFIVAALQRQKDGWTPERIIRETAYRSRGKPIIVGYARPIATGDERVAAMARVSAALGFEVGAHLVLAYAIDAILRRDHRESINLAGYMAAFLSDQGLTQHEIYRIYSLCVNGGVHACYTEARDRPPNSFLPLRCVDIDYQGVPPRELPCAPAASTLENPQP